MTRAHTLIKRRGAGIGLDHHPNRTEIAGRRRCPHKQPGANTRAQQRGLDKEFQKVSIRAIDLDLHQANNRRITLGYLQKGGLEFVGMKRQFSPASGQECVIIAPDGLGAEAQ